MTISNFRFRPVIRWHRRRAMILVLVMVMLVVVGLILAQMCSITLREASNSQRAERELRKRWAVSSLQFTLLPRGNSLLTSMIDEQAFTPNDEAFHLQRTLRLSGLRIELDLADESSKLNLAHLVNACSHEVARKTINSFQNNSIRLPIRADIAAKGQSPSCWDDVFDSSELTRVQFAQYSHRLSRNLTLWGGKATNAYTASDQTLDSLWNAIIGRSAPDTFHTLRKQDPPVSLEVLLRTSATSKQQATDMTAWLTDESLATSLWLQIEDRSSTECYFFVRAGRDRSARQLGFVW